MILSDYTLKAMLDSGELVVDPITDSSIQPASIDCRIGAIARPKHIIITPELPKTRSGKIMRRVLKAIVNNDDVGDTSTLANPEIVDILSDLITLQ